MKWKGILSIKVSKESSNSIKISESYVPVVKTEKE